MDIGICESVQWASAPTAWLTRLYPLLMGAAFKVFGVYTHAAALALLAVTHQECFSLAHNWDVEQLGFGAAVAAV